MRRVLVMGVSPGAGKSTFAQHLGVVLGLPVTHLDSLFWNPGWVQSTKEEFLSRQQVVVNQEAWIIEGNYTSSEGYALRLNQADTLIYLEVPLVLCLYRVFKRRVAYRHRRRVDMAPGCPEKIDWEFVRFIVTTYHHRRRSISRHLETFEALREGNRSIWLKGSRQMATLLDDMPEAAPQLG